MNAQPSIVQRYDSGWLTAAPTIGATHVYVLSYHDGRLVAFTRRPVMSERAGSRYCYVVDTSEQHAAFDCQAPSRQDAYAFSIRTDVTWRVTYAEQFVRAGTHDAAQIVGSAVEDQLWTAARQFAPEDAAQAEQSCRQALAALSAIAAGLAVVRATAKVTSDKGLTTAARRIDSTRHAGSIDRLRQQQEAERLQHLRGLMDGDESMLLYHLATHPGDTGTILKIMIEARNRGEATRLELFDRLVAHDFIQDGDLDSLRAALLGAGSPGVLAPGTGMTAPRAVTAPRTVTAIGGPSAGSTPTPAPDLRAADLVVSPDPDLSRTQPEPARGTGRVREWKPTRRPDPS